MSSNFSLRPEVGFAKPQKEKYSVVRIVLQVCARILKGSPNLCKKTKIMPKGIVNSTFPVPNQTLL